MNRHQSGLRGALLLLILAAATNLPAAQHSAATLLVVLKGDNTLGFVDPQARQQTASVRVGAGPHEVVATADGKLAFVSNYGPNNGNIPGATISVVSLRDQKELRTLDTGADSRPHGLLLVNGKLYFTTETPLPIGRYDLKAGRIDWRFDVGQKRTHMLVMTRDRKTLFASNLNSNSISVIDLGSHGKATTLAIPITGGRRPEGLDLSPDQKELWTVTNDDSRVSIIDVATRKVVAILDPRLQQPNRIKFTLDGKHVLVNDTRGGQVVVVDAVTRQVVKRLDVGKASQGMLIAPHGATAYVACTNDNNLAIIDTVALAVIGHIPTGPQPDGMAWVEGR